MKIVFDGYISGEAKKYFIKRSKINMRERK